MITWVEYNKQYSSGLKGMVGKIDMFNIHWDVLHTKDRDRPYRLICRLPGLKDDLGRFKDQEECKERAEHALSVWVERAGFNLTNGDDES